MLIQLVFVAGFQLWGESQNEPLDPAIPSASAPAKLREELLEARLREQIQVGVSHGGSLEHRVRESMVAEQAASNYHSNGVAAYFGQHDESTNVEDSVVGAQTNDNAFHHETLAVAAHVGHDETDMHENMEVDGVHSSFAETTGGTCKSQADYCACQSDDGVETSPPLDQRACTKKKTCDWIPSPLAAPDGECMAPDDCYGDEADTGTCATGEVCCKPKPSLSQGQAAKLKKNVKQAKQDADFEWNQYLKDPSNCLSLVDGKKKKDKCEAFGEMVKLDESLHTVWKRTNKASYESFHNLVQVMNEADAFFFGQQQKYWKALRSKETMKQTADGKSVKYRAIRLLLKSIYRRIRNGRKYREGVMPKPEALQALQSDHGLWSGQVINAENVATLFTGTQIQKELTEAKGAYETVVQTTRSATTTALLGEKQFEVGTGANGKMQTLARFGNWFQKGGTFKSKESWWNLDFEQNKQNTNVWTILEKERDAIMKHYQKINILERMLPLAQDVEDSLRVEAKENDFRKLYLDVEATFAAWGLEEAFSITPDKPKDE